MTIKKNSGLRFANYVPISDLDSAFSNNSSIRISADDKNLATLAFWCSSGYYQGNNILGYLDVFLPEGTAAGTFYPVDLVSDKGLYIYYLNEAGNRDYLLADSFNLKNGGVQINSAPQPPAEAFPAAPVPTALAPVQELQTPDLPFNPDSVRQQPENTKAQTNATVAAEVSSKAISDSPDTSASSVSSSPSEKNISQQSSAVPSSEKPSDTTTASDTDADSDTRSVSNNKDNKKSQSGFALFITAAVVLDAATAIIIIKVKGKKEE